MASSSPDPAIVTRSDAPRTGPGDAHPRRLTLVIPTLRAGGAERILSVLANAWAAEGDDVTVLTWVAGNEMPHFALDDRVTECRLDLIGDSRGPLDVVRNTLRRLRVLRRAISSSRPDVVIAFMDRTNVTVLAAMVGSSAPVVVAEHNDPHREVVSLPYRLARRLLYPRAARVVVLTRRAGAYFTASLQSRIRVIPNPVVLPLRGARRSARTTQVVLPARMRRATWSRWAASSPRRASID